MSSSATTIAAIASPPGTGAIGLIRVSGPESLALAKRMFQPIPVEFEPRYQYFGRCFDSNGAVLDEVLLTYFQAPASFTGEEVVEISCHGGIVVCQGLLDRLLELGAVPAEPGEFSQRAFLNGKIDLTQAEAIMDLISAKTGLAAKAAGQQLAGGLAREMEILRTELIETAAHVEAYIDFPDEDIDPESADSIRHRMNQALDRINSLLDTAERGRILREGIRTVLCGAPNAGKSSLLNRFLGFDRAIVSHRAGTTRDTIEETISLGGIPLRIVDTAGIRDSQDDIERQGIDRSRKAVEGAELVILLIDSTESRHQLQQIAIPEGVARVKILNKSDLEPHPDWADEPDAIAFSCATGAGFENLKDEIVRTVTGSDAEFQSQSLMAINARHQHYLNNARSLLTTAHDRLVAGESPEFIAFEIREALESIGAVVGKTDVEEILGSIFSSFCIGK